MTHKTIRVRDVMKPNFDMVDGVATVADALRTMIHIESKVLIVKKRSSLWAAMTTCHKNKSGTHHPCGVCQGSTWGFTVCHLDRELLQQSLSEILAFY